MNSLKFNRWNFIKKIENTRPILWVAKCDCGTEKVVHKSNLIRGLSKSCGCWNREVLDQKSNDSFSKTRTYRIYTGIKTRCYNKRSKAYSWYGARGIKMCKRWDNYRNFVADMGLAPDGLSIDRVDPNGNYEPNNCRWANKYLQANNTRANRKIAYKNQIKTAAQWCRDLNLNYANTMRRINRDKWPIEKAFKEIEREK